MSSRFSELVTARNSNSATQKRKQPKVNKPEPPRGVGRPRAKRSNADYRQVTAYMRRQTYADARKLLFDDGREFSELIEELVTSWVRSKKQA